MASKARRISNNAGSAKSFLNAVDKPNKGEVKIAKAVALAGKQKDLVQSIMSAVKTCLDDSDEYQKNLDSKSIDVTLGRIATLLDEFSDTLGKDQINDAKKEILEKISGISSDLSLKLMLINAISDLFDDKASKDDIENLKKWMSENLVQDKALESSGQKTQDEFENAPSLEEPKEDNQEGDYKDSTNAKNFMTLQTYINKQFDVLNENIKNIPGQSGLLSKMFKSMGVGFGATFGGIAKLTKGVAKTIAKTASIAKSFGKFTFGGIFKIVSGIAKGVGSVIKGIGSLGKKVGGAIASPFKKIGGFFSKLNPFKRSENKAEERKQKAKDKVIAVMAKIIDKIWKLIEPFVDKVAFFMGLITKFVIVPIAIIALKVFMIVAAITAIGIGLVLAYFWIKKKIARWIEYFKSGQWWEDLKAKMLDAWEWMKDFGKWIWSKFIEFGKWYLKTLLKAWKFILIDIPVWIWDKLCEFGVWLWDKLCEFGQWLYDNYIDKYLVQPFKQYIWEPVKKLWNEKIWPKIEPFVISLTELKDKIVKAFSAWDTNKSIWENLKNISGIIKDAVVEWWNGSPFKEFYDKYLDPIVKSLGDLINRIKAIWANFKWDESKSFIENLKDIGGILVDGIKEWWNDENNPIKKIYNQYVKPIIDKIRDIVTPIIEKLKEIWNSLKEKAGNMEWQLPTMLGKGTIRPFGFLVGKPMYEGGNVAKAVVGAAKAKITSIDESMLAKNQHTENWGKIPDNVKNAKSIEDVNKQLKHINSLLNSGAIKTDEGKALAAKNIAYLKEKSKQLASQQVQQAAQPIQQIESMKNESNAELKKTGESINKDIADKENRQNVFNMQQSNKNDEMWRKQQLDNQKIIEMLKDPLAVPIPYAVHEQQNPATMETY